MRSGLYIFQSQQKNSDFMIAEGHRVSRIIYTDKYKLIEILTNLLDNAIKFIFKESVALGISSESYSQGKLKFTARDTRTGYKAKTSRSCLGCSGS